MKRKTIGATLSILLLAVLAAAPARAASFKVVVHEANPVRSMTADRASRLFLKKVTRWDDGSEVRPVDQRDDATARESFSESVHGKDVGSIQSYWQRMIFSGRATPPPELATDAEVLAFVRANPGAIGYVDGGVPAGSGVTVIEIEE